MKIKKMYFVITLLFLCLSGHQQAQAATDKVESATESYGQAPAVEVKAKVGEVFTVYMPFYEGYSWHLFDLPEHMEFIGYTFDLPGMEGNSFRSDRKGSYLVYLYLIRTSVWRKIVALHITVE